MDKHAADDNFIVGNKILYIYIYLYRERARERERLRGTFRCCSVRVRARGSRFDNPNITAHTAQIYILQIDNDKKNKKKNNNKLLE